MREQRDQHERFGEKTCVRLPKVMYPTFAPVKASVPCSSCGGSACENSTCGAVWLPRRPSLNSYIRPEKAGNQSSRTGNKKMDRPVAYLHEYLPDNNIVVVHENSTEDHRYSILLSRNVPEELYGDMCIVHTYTHVQRFISTLSLRN